MQATLNLINENAVEIGADYEVKIRLANSPNLKEYTGNCQVKSSNDQLIVTPLITVLDIDFFSLKIAHTALANVTSGEYKYDVLFVKTDHRFYSNGGNIAFVNRVTSV